MDLKYIMMGVVFVLLMMVYGHYHHKSQMEAREAATSTKRPGVDPLVAAIEDHNAKKGRITGGIGEMGQKLGFNSQGSRNAPSYSQQQPYGQRYQPADQPGNGMPMQSARGVSNFQPTSRPAGRGQQAPAASYYPPLVQGGQ